MSIFKEALNSELNNQIGSKRKNLRTTAIRKEHAYIKTYIPTYLPTHPPTHPPTYLPTYLPTYILARLKNLFVLTFSAISLDYRLFRCLPNIYFRFNSHKTAYLSTIPLLKLHRSLIIIMYPLTHSSSVLHFYTL